MKEGTIKMLKDMARNNQKIDIFLYVKLMNEAHELCISEESHFRTHDINYYLWKAAINVFIKGKEHTDDHEKLNYREWFIDIPIILSYRVRKIEIGNLLQKFEDLGFTINEEIVSIKLPSLFTIKDCKKALRKSNIKGFCKNQKIEKC